MVYRIRQVHPVVELEVCQDTERVSVLEVQQIHKQLDTKCNAGWLTLLVQDQYGSEVEKYQNRKIRG